MNIISTGYMTAKAVQLVDELHEMGIEVGLVDLIQLKPIPLEVVTEVLQTSRKIVTLEENTLTGGLGSAISELISDVNLRVQLLRSALPDKHMFSYGSRDWLLESEGLSHDKLYTIISSFYSNENWV
jgi:transketolase C-terminal domain/subunit